jgi:hypothetical protein
MAVFFEDPNDVPVPPEEVKIREFYAQPYPDGRRVTIHYHITPFQIKPNLEVVILQKQNEVSASLSMVEIIENKSDFTMHLKNPIPGHTYKIEMRVFYTDLPFLDETGEEMEVGEVDIVGETVDTAECEFELPVE